MHASTPTLNPDTQAYYRQVLRFITEAGVEMISILRTEAQLCAAPQPPAEAPAQADPADTQAQPQAQPAPEPIARLAAIALVFDRTARAVRRTILLARKLDEPLPTTAQPPKPPRTTHKPQNPVDRVAARKQLLRTVEDAISSQAAGPDAQALHAELLDRLDSPDLDAEILARPAADIIKDICRDLGLQNLPLAPPWLRRTPADIETLNARAAAPPNPRTHDAPATSPPFPPKLTLHPARTPQPSLRATHAAILQHARDKPR